jgi:hypothetical protein
MHKIASYRLDRHLVHGEHASTVPSLELMGRRDSFERVWWTLGALSSCPGGHSSVVLSGYDHTWLVLYFLDRNCHCWSGWTLFLGTVALLLDGMVAIVALWWWTCAHSILIANVPTGYGSEWVEQSVVRLRPPKRGGNSSGEADLFEGSLDEKEHLFG